MITVLIFSPTEKKEYKNVISVSLPTNDGLIQIRKNHVEAFIFLQKGRIVLKNDKNILREIKIKTQSVAFVYENIVKIIL